MRSRDDQGEKFTGGDARGNCGEAGALGHAASGGPERIGGRGRLLAPLMIEHRSLLR